MKTDPLSKYDFLTLVIMQLDEKNAENFFFSSDMFLHYVRTSLDKFESKEDD